MNEATPHSAAAPRRNAVLWVMVVVFALPWVAALVFFYAGDLLPDLGTTANGELISPVRPVPALALHRLDGTELSTAVLKGKWTLLTVASSECGVPCQQNLYKIRQVRLAMADDRKRVQRLMLVTDKEFVANLGAKLREYEGTEVVAGPGHAMNAFMQVLSPQGEDVRNRIFMLDPLGNVMMSYRPDADPVGILKDLQHLLKISQAG